MRLTAAVAVVCAHSGNLLPGIPAWLTDHGQEAVSFFFVLSGFVIAYTTDAHPVCWRSYTRARAVRLYSVVLPVLPTILLVDGLGRSIAPAWYAANDLLGPEPSLYDFAATLTFTNELWFQHVYVGTDEPFWSLGFEVAYYALFGILLYCRGRWRLYLSLAWCLFVGPRILLYLPLWLLGVAAFRLIRGGAKPLSPRAAWFVLALLAVGYAVWNGHTPGPMQAAWLSTNRAVSAAIYHLVIGLFAASAIVALGIVTSGRAPFKPRLARPGQWLAGASFTLYLLHLPLIYFAAALLPPSAPLLARLAALFGIGLIVLLLAEVGERRKRQFDLAAGQLFGRIKAICGKLRAAPLPLAD